MEENSHIKQVLNKALWAKLQRALCASYTSDLPQNWIWWSYICILTGRHVKPNVRAICRIPTSAFPPLRHLHQVLHCKYLVFLINKVSTSSLFIIKAFWSSHNVQEVTKNCNFHLWISVFLHLWRQIIIETFEIMIFVYPPPIPTKQYFSQIYWSGNADSSFFHVEKCIWADFKLEVQLEALQKK